MNFTFTKESLPNLEKLKLQGVDISNIPVIIERVKLVNNNLELEVRPAIYPKDTYQLNAKSDCKYCGGKGWVRYQLDQDDIKSAVCYICFPETKQNSDWLREATKY